MGMFDFRKFFGLDSGSKDAAKQRLRLVLIQDRASVSQETLEAMKRDLIEVISNYVEFDSSELEVKMETQKEKIALIASIPIADTKK